ncbi:MAG: hypothetical protein HYR84_06920 [Planctomycetes bacterium]|nr:hypothetical protein [Planctomycetota bacterium]
MRRRVVHVIGWIASVFWFTSLAAAQEVHIKAPDHSFIPSIAPEALSVSPLNWNDGSKPGGASGELKISPNTSMPRLGAPEEPRNSALVDAAIESSRYVNPRFVANSSSRGELGFWERSGANGHDQTCRLVEDYRNFYLTSELAYVGLALAVAAPIANTHADQGLRDWYQRQAGSGRSRGADETASVFKRFGDFQVAVPAYFMLSLSGNLFPDSPWLGPASEFGSRSLRALAVGAPAVGVLQVGLGGGRPFSEDSRWRPFHSSHGVSGHAFVGAVPFLTAASMTDSYAVKAMLFAGSLGPAWSRIHHDDHYLSQALLGWSIAYLSVHAVNQTESRWQVVPIDIPNGVGMGVVVRY